MTRIRRRGLGLALAAVLLATPAAARPGGHHHSSSGTAVPVSPYNARWPREPASGPLPAR